MIKKKSVRGLSLVSFSIKDMRSGTRDGVPDLLIGCEEFFSLSSAASRYSRHTPFFFLKSLQYNTCLFAVSTQQFTGATLLIKLLCCKVRRGYKLSDTACTTAVRHPFLFYLPSGNLEHRRFCSEAMSLLLYRPQEHGTLSKSFREQESRGRM